MSAVRAVVIRIPLQCGRPAPQFSASPDLQNEFIGAVIGAMESHTDLSTQILNNPELKQRLLGELVPLIYEELNAAG